jgi:regulator of RNase E activity RraA
MAARMRELSGVVVDGAVRDVDACEQFEFPVHARGTVPITARGRIMQEAWNVPVRLGDMAVRPGDIVMADVNGVVVIRVEALEQTLERAEAIAAKEQAMIDALRAGEDILSVDKRFNYENMLKTK